MRLPVCIALLIGLAACQTGIQQEPVSASAPATVPVSASAGPGATPVTVAFGADVLQKACVEPRPSFDATPMALARIGGFVRNSQTGTYFSQTHDLSVKVVPGRCSVVMSGRFSTDSSNSVVTRTSPQSAVRPGRTVTLSGKTYLSFSVEGG